MIPLIKNFKEVIENRNIDRMSKELYHFLTLYYGFIAHYDINGFKATYRAPRDFADVFIRHFGYAIIGNPIFAEWGYISFKN